MRKISQREARLLQQRLTKLENHFEQQRNAYVKDWPGGVHIARHSPAPATVAVIHTARLLGHAVVVTEQDGEFNFYALPQAKSP